MNFWKDATGRLGIHSLHFGTPKAYEKVHQKVFGWAPDMIYNDLHNRWEDPDGVVLLVPSDIPKGEGGRG